MPRDSHFVALENMYLAAPINEFYDPRIQVSEAAATVEIELAERFFPSPAVALAAAIIKYGGRIKASE